MHNAQRSNISSHFLYLFEVRIQSWMVAHAHQSDCAIAVLCGTRMSWWIIQFSNNYVSVQRGLWTGEAVRGWVDASMEIMRAIIAFLFDRKLTNIKCRNQRNDEAIWINEMESSEISKCLLTKRKWNRLPSLSSNQRLPVFANIVSIEIKLILQNAEVESRRSMVSLNGGCNFDEILSNLDNSRYQVTHARPRSQRKQNSVDFMPFWSFF